MKNPDIKASKHNQQTNNALISKALLELLRENGGDRLSVNKRELARRSGVSYKVVCDHFRRGFVANNVDAIAADFQAVVSRKIGPEIMAARLLTCARDNAVWFSIEAVSKSYRLWDAIASGIRKDLTADWIDLGPARNDKRYRQFCSELFQIVQEWMHEDFADEAIEQHRTRLAKLLADHADKSQSK